MAITPKISNMNILVGNQLWVMNGAFQWDFDTQNNTELEVLENVYSVISCPKGSQVLFRDFGTDWSIIDQPGNLGTIQMQTAVLLACAQWEPRAKFNLIQFTVTSAANALAGVYDMDAEMTIDLSVAANNAIFGPPAATTAWIIENDMMADYPTILLESRNI